MASGHTQEIHKPTHIEAADEGGADFSKADIYDVSTVDQAIKDGVEDEKCVVAIYKTTKDQKDKFVDHLKTCELAMLLFLFLLFACLEVFVNQSFNLSTLNDNK